MDTTKQGFKNTKVSGDKEKYFHMKKHEKVVFIEKIENDIRQESRNQQNDNQRQFKDNNSNSVYIPKSQIENRTVNNSKIENPLESENLQVSWQDNSQITTNRKNSIESEKTNGKWTKQGANNADKSQESTEDHTIQTNSQEPAEQNHPNNKNKDFQQVHFNQQGKNILNSEKISKNTGINKKTQYLERQNNHKTITNYPNIDGYDIQQINESIPYRPIRFSQQIQKHNNSSNNQGQDHYQHRDQKRDNKREESSYDSLQEEYNLDINIKHPRNQRITSGSTQMYVQASNVKNDINTNNKDINKQKKYNKNEGFQNNYQAQNTKKKESTYKKLESKKQSTQPSQMAHETKWIALEQTNEQGDKQKSRQQGTEEVLQGSQDEKQDFKRNQNKIEKLDEKLNDSQKSSTIQQNSGIDENTNLLQKDSQESKALLEDQEKIRKEVKRQLIREKLASNTSTDRFFYMPNNEAEDKENEQEELEEQYGKINESRMMAILNGQQNNKMISSGQQNTSNINGFNNIQQQSQYAGIMNQQQSVNPIYPPQMVYYYYPVSQPQQQLNVSSVNGGIPSAAVRPQEEGDSKTQELQLQQQHQLQGIGNAPSGAAPTILGRYPNFIPQQQYHQFQGNMIRPQFIPITPSVQSGVPSAPFMQPTAQAQPNQQTPSLQGLKQQQQQQQFYQQPIMQGYQSYPIQSSQYQYGNQYYQFLAEQQHISMQQQQQQQLNSLIPTNFQQQQMKAETQTQIASSSQQQLIQMSGQQSVVSQPQQQSVQLDQSKQREYYSTDSAEQSTVTAITAASNISTVTGYFSDYAEEFNRQKEELLWLYIDKQQNQQGPFASIHMDLWNRQGYFPEELLIQFIQEDKWMTLQEFQKKQEEKEILSENS